MTDIRPGQVVQGPRWPQPVEVKLVEELGEYIRLVGATTGTATHVDQLIPRDELGQLSTTQIEADFMAEPRDVFLALEARRYRYASMYDPLLAVNTSNVDPLPHQIEAVYGYVLKLPRIRFLISDDPGAGKTIMAGLILKELKLRHQVRRILIVCPGHLKDQWRREMKDRFEETFVVLDRGLVDALYGESAWQREAQIITSLDFAKQDDILASLASAHFDLIIVDEAHKMSAYRYGNKLEKTSRYRLGEVLSRIATHLLFLTATPHRGDPENFRLFLDLLEPGFFATSDMLEASILNQDNPLFIRRMKEDMRDFEGHPLFLPRHVETKAFNLGVESPAEKTLYNDLSRYVNEQYNRALTRDRRRNVAFALVILQRRLASSTYALLRSLERRKARLEELLKIGLDGPPTADSTVDPETAENMSEEERWRLEEIWETLSVAENREELLKEIDTLEGLIRQAKGIIRAGHEVKLRHLQLAFHELEQEHPGSKILIFTESRDTLTYLEERVREWGYSVCTIHGGMRLPDRIAAEKVFKNEAQVMIATEAAGEGINLQFCNLMINYDIPWNPNRLEQRMGRIHRYLQTKECFIFNLVAEDTREGRVLSRLFEKLDEIRLALGNDRVFDVLGEIFYGKNLAQLMVEAAASARNIEEILAELDVEVDEEYITTIKENLGESLASRHIDYTRIREMADRAREYRLIPEYTEAFFKRALEAADGKWRDRGGGFIALDTVPYSLRCIAEEDDFRRRHGPLPRRYPLIAFDKGLARLHAESEFVSFGHPLFEAALAWVEQRLTGSIAQGAVYSDPDGRMDGLLLFYEGDVRDGLGQVAGQRLFALYADSATGEARATNPALLWDLAEGGDGDGLPPPDLGEAKAQAMQTLLPVLARYQSDLQEERDRQAEVKRKYGVKSLEYLILRLDGDLISLYARKEQGQRVDLVIHNKEEQKRGYEQALEELRRTIVQESSLTMGMPRFVGAVRVVPQRPADPAMVEDADIEMIGMTVTMEYEAKNGRVPEDVSAENLGFDVRSTDPVTKGKRYIEVKARSQVGPVALTQNEWFKAGRFGTDYYLYVVLRAASQPELYVVPDPASCLEPQEKIEVRYVVPVDAIMGEGERV